MKALILNSGLGKRLGQLTEDKPKCLIELENGQTILSRQLRQLERSNIKEIVITTGKYHKRLIDYCEQLNLKQNFEFVLNSLYDKTNYIYSIYCAKKFLDDDILLMHGDIVLADGLIEKIIKSDKSIMVTSSTLPLPEKDFKAVIDNGKVTKIGIEFFKNAFAAQPVYLIKREDFKIWLDKIIEFCEADDVNGYAEKAFNLVSDRCNIYPFDVKNELCAEVDTQEDLIKINGEIT